LYIVSKKVKKYRVTLSESERIALRSLIASGKYKNTKQKRAQIMLACDEGSGGKKMKDSEIAKAFDVRERTVERLRRRFVEESYEIALHGKKRSVEKEKLFDSQVEAKLIALRCSAIPAGHNKWSLRLLADKMVELNYVESISHESVRQILKKHPLKPGK